MSQAAGGEPRLAPPLAQHCWSMPCFAPVARSAGVPSEDGPHGAVVSQPAPAALNACRAFLPSDG